MQAVDIFGEGADMVFEGIWLALQTPPTLALPHEGGGDCEAFCNSDTLLFRRYFL